MSALLLLLLFLLISSTSVKAQEHYVAEAMRDLRRGKNTFGFQPNMGQVGDFEGKKAKDVLFFTRHSGIDLYVKEDGASYVIRDVKKTFRDRDLHERMSLREGKVERDTMIWARVDLRVVGVSVREEMIEYSEPMDGYTNYYLSHCPDGVLFVPSYRVVRIREVYSGVDWIWRIGEDGVLHHEFEVRDGINVEKIKIEVKWAEVDLSEDGKRLRLRTPVGEIEDGEIVGYSSDGKVDLRYLVDDGRFISFKVEGNYHGKLIIDPPLARLWATYYGGGDEDEGYSVTTDALGNVFVTGNTYSTNFPTYNPGGAYYQESKAGSYDVFILKFSNSGIRQWATYYGGNDMDVGYSIATDGSGNVFVTGSTYSTNFPTQNPGGGAYYQGNLAQAGYPDVFILKFEGGEATAVEDREIPRAFAVYQNYPNPFNPGTEIRFDLPEAGNVKVEVFNLLGEKVAALYDGFMDAGYDRKIRWDADGFPSGVYFYRVSLNGKYVDVKKMVLVK